MTPAEIVISVIGIVSGYWVVSKFFEGSAAPSEPSSAGDAWFLVLGVSESATAEEISAAYKRRISQYHPDKVAQMGEEIRAIADSKSQQINAAYDTGMRLRRR